MLKVSAASLVVGRSVGRSVGGCGRALRRCAVLQSTTDHRHPLTYLRVIRYGSRRAVQVGSLAAVFVIAKLRRCGRTDGWLFVCIILSTCVGCRLSAVGCRLSAVLCVVCCVVCVVFSGDSTARCCAPVLQVQALRAWNNDSTTAEITFSCCCTGKKLSP